MNYQVRYDFGLLFLSVPFLSGEAERKGTTSIPGHQGCMKGPIMWNLPSPRTKCIPFLVMLAWVFPQSLCSQRRPTAVVRGTVLDDSTGMPLPLANVFIANSTIGAATDVKGILLLKSVPLGTQQVVASFVGYAAQTRAVVFADTIEYEVSYRLKPRAVQMPPVLVEESDPVEWKRNLHTFVVEFLGSTSNASQCRILNPQVLDFAVDEETERFSATAREPLFIVNEAFGYRCQ
jgi:hypothetical protein